MQQYLIWTGNLNVFETLYLLRVLLGFCGSWDPTMVCSQLVTNHERQDAKYWKLGLMIVASGWGEAQAYTCRIGGWLLPLSYVQWISGKSYIRT
jgi:hypothetical protein